MDATAILELYFYQSGMAKNHGASRFNTWSELIHDVLFLIMMKVGVVDFVAFSGVCKSWRSLAVSNKNKFIESKPPMSIWIHRHGAFSFRKDYLYLEDSVYGRITKRALPHSAGRTLVGLTCGYLVFFGKKACDFWLLNPITRHGIHFPAFPFCLNDNRGMIRTVLVFSPSISGWVLVVAPKHSVEIWFSIAGEGKGKGAWNHFNSRVWIIDLHAFKGKIYTITEWSEVCEIRLNPRPKLVTILKIKDPMEVGLCSRMKILSLGEYFYLIGRRKCRDDSIVWELDTTGEMKFVQPKNTIGYDYFVNFLKHGEYVIAWPNHPHAYAYYYDNIRKDGSSKMWYFPHDCLRVDILHES